MGEIHVRIARLMALISWVSCRFTKSPVSKQKRTISYANWFLRVHVALSTNNKWFFWYLHSVTPTTPPNRLSPKRHARPKCESTSWYWRKSVCSVTSNQNSTWPQSSSTSNFPKTSPKTPAFSSWSTSTSTERLTWTESSNPKSVRYIMSKNNSLGSSMTLCWITCWKKLFRRRKRRRSRFCGISRYVWRKKRLRPSHKSLKKSFTGSRSTLLRMLTCWMSLNWSISERVCSH